MRLAIASKVYFREEGLVLKIAHDDLLHIDGELFEDVAQQVVGPSGRRMEKWEAPISVRTKWRR